MKQTKLNFSKTDSINGQFHDDQNYPLCLKVFQVYNDIFQNTVLLSLRKGKSPPGG